MIKVKQLETTMDGWFAWQWYMVVASTTNTTPGIQIVNGKMRNILKYFVRHLKFSFENDICNRFILLYWKGKVWTQSLHVVMIVFTPHP